MNVVFLGEPAKLTTDAEMKSAPLTVIINSSPPAIFDSGAIEVIAGIKLLTVTALLKAEDNPGELAHIFIISPKEYFIDS